MPESKLAGTLALVLALGLSLPAQADVVELRSGEWLLGTVVEQGETGVVLDHTLLGRLDLPGTEVTAVRIGETALAEAEPPPALLIEQPPPAPLAPIRPGLLGTGWLRGWERTVELGVNGSRGNSETFDVRTALGVGYEGDDRRWRFETGYSRAEDEGETTDEAAFAELVRDWLWVGSPWFSFAQARWDFDQFKAWDHRAAVSAGVGYQFLDDERWNLRGRAGLGLTRTFGSEDDQLTPELILGLEALRRFGENHEIAGYTRFFPDLGELGEYRNLTGAHWKVRFGEPRDLSFKVGFENVHETVVEGDARRNDLTYFGTLVYDF